MFIDEEEAHTILLLARVPDDDYFILNYLRSNRGNSRLIPTVDRKLIAHALVFNFYEYQVSTSV